MSRRGVADVVVVQSAHANHGSRPAGDPDRQRAILPIHLGPRELQDSLLIPVAAVDALPYISPFPAPCNRGMRSAALRTCMSLRPTLMSFWSHMAAMPMGMRWVLADIDRQQGPARTVTAKSGAGDGRRLWHPAVVP